MTELELQNRTAVYYPDGRTCSVCETHFNIVSDGFQIDKSGKYAGVTKYPRCKKCEYERRCQPEMKEKYKEYRRLAKDRQGLSEDEKQATFIGIRYNTEEDRQEAIRAASRRKYYKMMGNPEKKEKERLRGLNRYRKLASTPEGRRVINEQGKVRVRRRQAVLKMLPEHFTFDEWVLLCSFYGNICISCYSSDKVLSVDHVVPLSKGGVNTIDNIQPLCTSCNSSKGTKATDYRREYYCV